jgi:hypothetical protein
MLPKYADYLRLLREAVIYAPVIRSKDKEIVCKRPNSFAYIENIDQLMSPNVGISQGRGKDFFFDRKMANAKNPLAITEISYPMVAVSERTFQFDFVFDENTGHSLTNAKVFVLDTLKHKSCNAGYCDNRHPVELFQDCSDIYTTLLGYLYNVSYFYKDDFGVWMNINHYEWLVENEKSAKNGMLFSEMKQHKGYKSEFLKYLRMRNKDILGRNYSMEGQGALYGIMVDLNLPMDPCFDFDYNFREYPDTVVGRCAI